MRHSCKKGFAENLTTELTISPFLEKSKVKKAETYFLFKTPTMLLSATTTEDQPDADLHSVQNQKCGLLRDKQKWPAIC